MKLKYKVDLEDVVEFNRYHVNNSPGMRRSKTILKWGVSSIILIVTGLWALLSKSFEVFIVGLLVAAFDLISFQYRWNKRNDRHVQKLYNEGPNKRILCVHDLEMGDLSIQERSEYGSQETKYDAVEQVISTPTHSFIYIAAILAHIVPRAKVIEGNYDEFITEIRSKVQARRA